MKITIEIEFSSIGEEHRAGVRAVENLVAYTVSSEAQKALLGVMHWLRGEGVSLQGVSAEIKQRATYSDGDPIELETIEVQEAVQ